MKLEVVRQDIWAVNIEDRPGGLAEKLESLAQTGANPEFVNARRSPEKPGSAVIFVTLSKDAKQVKAVRQAGFSKASSLHCLRVAAANRPGLGARLTRELAEAGISLRGFSGAAIGGRAVFHLAFDSNADTNKAMRRLSQVS